MKNTPLARYQRHIAHANNFIFKEVIDNLIQNSNEQTR